MKPEFQIDSLSLYMAQSAPLLFLLAIGLLLMLLDAFKAARTLPMVAAVGLLASAALSLLNLAPADSVAFGGMLETGGLAPYIHAALCGAGFLATLFVGDYFSRYQRPANDIYALLTFAVIGMSMMANARDLIMVFIGLETMSICLYIFAAAFKTEVTSNESGLKYFLLGAFASAFLLFGIALLYGLTGTTSFAALAEQSEVIAGNPSIFLAAVGLILVGVCFKVAAFPFHTWAPDVYQGAPTPLAGFMATASKMATFLTLATFADVLNLTDYPKFATALSWIALGSMVYGNIVAARQTDLKRMLAYSGVAHAGYVLLGICAGDAGTMAVFFYMLVYTLMNIGAFGVLAMAERPGMTHSTDAWRGIGQKSPFLAGALAVFMFSLAGIPPLAGFMGKYAVFVAALNANLTVVAIIGILSSVVGAYYYLRVIMRMFFGETDADQINTRLAFLPTVGLVLIVLLIVVLGVFPSLVLTPVETLFALR